ncbi:hypothetical protein BJ165DRAFT_1464864 [Panaeolus papilionaceus]|nr:hypothetical protein BJ165DRAFT_1464864 [Panaeolus papilionaceus]
MDNKLKALKVADLRQILTKANLSAPAKSTKADLISRIQASQEALDAYSVLYPPADDLLAPPEEIDWNSVDQAASETQQSSTTVESAEPTPNPVVEPPITTPSRTTPLAETPAATAGGPLDPEIEKRRQRAARFGIPFVESRNPPVKKAPVTAAKPTADPSALEARKARFGLPTTTEPKPTQPSTTNPKKRPAPEAKPVDPEEEERKRKRAERFGLAKCE